ncbi:MAG: hypothetical protein JWQ74_1234 [Marmoricola sp.]|nr:hypothetical protein [Marmoricola sp.]
MNTQSRGHTFPLRAAAVAASGAVVTALLLVVNPAPAGAATVIPVGPGDIAPNESTYAGWHQGYDSAALTAAVTSGGLSLRGKSQVIRGYANNDTAGLAPGGVNADLDTTLVGASYDVTRGSAFFQVPVFVDADNNPATAPTFTTLRPVDAATTNKTIAATDQWTSSKALGAITAGDSYPLSTILDEINDHDSKTLAFGVLTNAGTSATVSSITWKGDTYKFTAATPTSSTVKNADVKTIETPSTYGDWHQGYENATGRQQVNGNGLVLAGKSQVIKGFSDTTGDLSTGVNANLAFVLPDASLTVAAGSDSVFFQVPVKFDNGSGVTFATLRSNGLGAGTHQFSLTDQWQVSKAVGSIAANTDAPLGDIIDALGTYKTLGFGVLTNPGDTATVSAVTFGTQAVTFLDQPAAAGSTSLTRVRDIRPDESTYAGWHQGSPTGVVSADNDSSVLKLGSTRSQVIKGYANNSSTLDGPNVNLYDALTTASYAVTSGTTFFQVPLFVQDGSSTVFTTLRPAAAAAPGDNRVDVGQEWVSSKAVGAIPANTPTLLGDILSAFTTYKVIGFGVYSDDGGNGAITSITWDGVKNTFTGNRSPVVAPVTATTTVGKSVTVTLTGTDADGDEVSYASIGTHGTATVVGDKLTFKPTPGYVGTASFNYVAADGKGASSTGAIAIKVTKAPATLTFTSSTSTATKKTYLRVRATAPAGASVAGARVAVQRLGKTVGTGSIVNGTVLFSPAKGLPKGKHGFRIFYKGTATTEARNVAYFVTVK